MDLIGPHFVASVPFSSDSSSACVFPGPKDIVNEPLALSKVLNENITTNSLQIEAHVIVDSQPSASPDVDCRSDVVASVLNQVDPSILYSSDGALHDGLPDGLINGNNCSEEAIADNCVSSDKCPATEAADTSNSQIIKWKYGTCSVLFAHGKNGRACAEVSNARASP